MEKFYRTVVRLLAAILLTSQTAGIAREIGGPGGIKSEQPLPSRYGYAVQDLLKFCEPRKGFWIDLGPGKGQVAIALFEKTPEITIRKEEDKVTARVKGDTVTYTVSSPSGIGGATITPGKSWPKRIVLRLNLRGLESLVVSNGRVELHVCVLSHSGNPRLLSVKEKAQEKKVEQGSSYWTKVQAFDAKGKPVQGLPEKGGYFEMVLPQALFEAKPKSLTIGWIDFYRN